MAVTVTLNVSAPCAGGEHMQVTATLDNEGVVRTRTFQVERSDIRGVGASDDALRDFALVCLRLFAPQVQLSQLRSRINAKTIDLTI